jgi:predicted nucleic acid-binding protein
MSWVVDTCILIDVLEDDPRFGESSACLLDETAREGLLICPVTYAELAPAFLGDLRRQNEFLDAIGVEYKTTWAWAETQHAHRAWFNHVSLRRREKTPRRPIADIMIGAFAQNHQGLLTRNPADFRAGFPRLTVRTP